MENNIEALKEILDGWSRRLSFSYAVEHGASPIKSSRDIARQIDALYPKKDEIEARERERIGHWLDKWWNRGIGGKQNWYELEAFIQSLKAKEVSNG